MAVFRRTRAQPLLPSHRVTIFTLMRPGPRESDNHSHDTPPLLRHFPHRLHGLGSPFEFLDTVGGQKDRRAESESPIDRVATWRAMRRRADADSACAPSPINADYWIVTNAVQGLFAERNTPMNDDITPLERNDPRIEKILEEKTLCYGAGLALTILSSRETDEKRVALILEDGEIPDDVAVFRVLTADAARTLAQGLLEVANTVDAANVGITGKLH